MHAPAAIAGGMQHRSHVRECSIRIFDHKCRHATRASIFGRDDNGGGGSGREVVAIAGVGEEGDGPGPPILYGGHVADATTIVSADMAASAPRQLAQCERPREGHLRHFSSTARALSPPFQPLEHLVSDVYLIAAVDHPVTQYQVVLLFLGDLHNGLIDLALQLVELLVAADVEVPAELLLRALQIALL